ncbi:MAG: response regulator [Acidimicrobiia bacterium]|nr:response regulator [Acidimicrobiia bacterium]
MSRRILIIDDEADIREVAQMSLELIAGWQVLTASSGTEGIELASSQQPEAVLLDVMMPGLDGPQTLQLLQANERTHAIPVIFLTAKAQTSEQRLLRDLGARGVIAKPFDPVTLAHQVVELLDSP